MYSCEYPMVSNLGEVLQPIPGHPMIGNFCRRASWIINLSCFPDIQQTNQGKYLPYHWGPNTNVRNHRWHEPDSRYYIWHKGWRAEQTSDYFRDSTIIYEPRLSEFGPWQHLELHWPRGMLLRVEAPVGELQIHTQSQPGPITGHSILQ